MMNNICLICLRTDKPIKPNIIVAEFHNEICGFPALISYTSSLYCNECDHILMKFYKFKQKCLKASKIYKDWMTGEIKSAIHCLNELLPSSSLGVWKASSKRIGTFEFQSTADIEEVNLRCYSTSHKFMKNGRNLEYALTDSNSSINDLNSEKSLQSVFDSDDDSKCTNNEIEVKVDHLIVDKKDSENMLVPNCNVQEGLNIKNEVHLSEELHFHPNDLKCENLDITTKHESKVKKHLSPKKGKEKPNLCKKIKLTPNNKKTNVTKIRKTNITNRRVADVKWINKSKEDLINTLFSFGDIVVDDGVAVDLDSIAKYVRDAGPGTLKSLREAICRDDLKSSDIKAKLITIQENHDQMKLDKLYYDSIFDTQYLKTQEEKLQEFERRKTYECYIKSEYKCDICYQPLKGSKHLKSHMKNFHDANSGGRCCPICKMWVGAEYRKRDRHTHLAVYKCKLCPLVTYYANTMKLHAEKHRGKKYNCDQCKQSFNCASRYYNHKSQHTRARAVCRACGRGFPSEKSLQVHTSVKHQNAYPEVEGAGVRCEECDVSFPSQDVFEAHRTDVHNSSLEQIESVHYLGNSLKDRRKGTLAIQTCRVCNLSQTGAAWLKFHYKKVHPDVSVEFQFEEKKALLCDICGAVYYTRPGLENHMRRHTGSRPFTCDLCPKQFRTAHDLSNHRLYHFPPALACPHCGKMVHTKSNLYSHLKSHEQTVRSYKCQYCQKGFFTIYTLNEHIRGVHYNVRRIRKRGKNEGGATGEQGKRSVKEKARRGKNIVSVDGFSTE